MIILNRIKTPDGTILTSQHVHDMQTHTDANGNIYGVDGGTEYLRRIGNSQDCEELSITIDENNLEVEFEKVREHLCWGSRGKNGDESLKWIPLKDMTDMHLHNLLYNYTGPIKPFIKECFEYEVYYRGQNNIVIPDPVE